MLFDEAMGTPDLKNSIVIPKGRAIPCQATETYYTFEGSEKINLKVTQSKVDESDISFVDIPWEGSLDLPPGRPAGQPIEVTYEYTEDERMKCSFVDVESGARVDVELTKDQLIGGHPSSVDKFFVE